MRLMGRRGQRRHDEMAVEHFKTRFDDYINYPTLTEGVCNWGGSR